MQIMYGFAANPPLKCKRYGDCCECGPFGSDGLKLLPRFDQIKIMSMNVNSFVPDRPPCHYKFAYGINVRRKIDELELQTMRVCVEWHKYGRER